MKEKGSPFPVATNPVSTSIERTSTHKSTPNHDSDLDEHVNIPCLREVSSFKNKPKWVVRQAEEYAGNLITFVEEPITP